MELKWIAQNIGLYDNLYKFVCLNIDGSDLIFGVGSTLDPDEKDFLKIEFLNINPKLINKRQIIESEITDIYLFQTDDDFRHSYNRSYNMMKFVTREDVVTFGAYSDNKRRMNPDNSYILCTTDFVNLLAKPKYIKAASDLDGTSFEALKCIFDKKLLAKELLK